MAGQSWTYFIVFWGVWLLIPIVIDIVDSFWQMLVVLRAMRRQSSYPPLPKTSLPRVSIIIPAHNEQVNIDRCITSLKAQTYPHPLMEIIIVNDGSTDRTSDVVIGHMTGMGHWNGHIRLHKQIIPARDFGGIINLLRGRQGGKPSAVNAGVAQANGDIIMNVDSDMVLERDAVEQAVRAFLNTPDMMAATAHLIVDQNLLVEADDYARISLDEQGLPLRKRLDPFERMLVACQFLEYVTAFHVGRQAESATETIFTLSGACAIFRAEALTAIGGYRGRTVSEDTDATLALHRQGWRIGYLPQVHVRLGPVTSWKHLHSQRIRWQRGELEVAAVNADRLKGRLLKQGRFWGWSLRFRLQKDHSLAIPRLVWTFLIFMLVFFGYPLSIIVQAMAVMYLLYVVTEMVQACVAYIVSRGTERELLRINLSYIVLMPFYRMATFWFRMSGVMLALSEAATWNVHGKGQKHEWIERVLKMLDSWAHRFAAFWAN